MRKIIPLYEITDYEPHFWDWKRTKQEKKKNKEHTRRRELSQLEP
jgi:hypothetical protein